MEEIMIKITIPKQEYCIFDKNGKKLLYEDFNGEVSLIEDESMQCHTYRWTKEKQKELEEALKALPGVCKVTINGISLEDRDWIDSL